MIKKVALGVLAVLVVLGLAGYLWLRSTFARDTVRLALASQISSAIGQPVSIDGIGISIFPRVAVSLTGAAIGQPTRIQAKSLRFGTDLGALLSRRIEHATVHLDGARVELPLPAFGSPKGSGSPESESGAAVEIVSIDEIVANNVEVISGGRTLRGDVELSPHGNAATLRKLSLSAEDTSVTGTGEIKNIAGPVAEIALNAPSLNFTRLLDFFTAFSSKSGFGTEGAPASSAKPAAVDLTVSLSADRATMGQLVLQKLSSRTRVTRQGVALDPIAFEVFDGSYKGTMTLAPASGSSLRLNAALSNIDVAAMTAFAGSPGVISGRLSGRMQVITPGAASADVLNSARGTARIDIRDGVVKRLGLVKSIVVATSMRADAKSERGSSDERFSKLGATLTVANGTAQTNDLQFESPDLLMNLIGSFRLDGSALDLKGNVQLSDELSKQAGRDLVRYTQQQGRVTLPVSIKGSAQEPSVQIDVANLAGRAIQNTVKEEIKKRLGGLFGR